MGDITFSDLTTWVVAAATLYILAYLSHRAGLWIERQKADFMEGYREERARQAKRAAWR